MKMNSEQIDLTTTTILWHTLVTKNTNELENSMFLRKKLCPIYGNKLSKRTTPYNH